VADFPYVIYLVCFDREIVKKSLDIVTQERGEEYLEKIVQISFDLPPIDQDKIDSILFSRLDSIIDLPIRLQDSLYWMNIYYDGIQPDIDTPRKVNKLANEIQVTYPFVKGEVNPTDFIALSSLRVNYPEVYKRIYKNRQFLTGITNIGASKYEIDPIRAAFDDILQPIVNEKKEIITRLLMRLFPKLKAIDNHHYGPDYLSIWYKELRACHPDRFNTYFRLSIQDNAISERTYKEIMAKSKNRDSLVKNLVELASQVGTDGKSKIPSFLNRLKADGINDSELESFLSAFLEVGDYILRVQDEEQGLFSSDHRFRVCWIMGKALMKRREEERLSLVTSSINNGEALSLAVKFAMALQNQHEKTGPSATPEEEKILSEDNMKFVHSTLMDKILKAADDGTLLNRPNLIEIILYWKDYGDKDKLTRWVSNIIANDSNLIKLLQTFVHYRTSQSVEDVVSKVIFYFDLKLSSVFLDPATIRGRVEKMSTEDMNEDDKRTVGLFLKAIEAEEAKKDSGLSAG
jgi:predicted KAP-like P-loop ATPase